MHDTNETVSSHPGRKPVSLQTEYADWDSLNAELAGCRRCPRLVAWREQVAATRKRAFAGQEYWGKPVPGFGDRGARILVLGLAPGAHGSNRTGRMFTGDGSGDFLFSALHAAGIASQPQSVSLDDGLAVRDLFITALCRCAPPGNKPTPEEIRTCRPFLLSEMALLQNLQGIVALGRLAYEQALFLLHQQGAPSFSHGAFHRPEGGTPWLLASYHPSRQNTQTRKLTPAMFAAIWQRAGEELR